MPFTFAVNWQACKGSSQCPCPNHLPPASRLNPIIRDPISYDPHLDCAVNSNDLATPADIDVILNTIPDLESQLRQAEHQSRMLSRLRRALKSEIEKVDKEKRRLRNHRDALSHAISSRACIRAPIRALPTEILTYIISLTIDDDFPVQRKKITKANALWPISWELKPHGPELHNFEMVCKRWRRDIIGCPSLWSRIMIIAHPLFENQHRIAQQIERSGQTKLDVCISACGNGTYPTDRRLHPAILFFLQPVVARIRSLHVSLPLSMLEELVPLHKSLPSLEFLHMHNLTPRLDRANPLSVIGSAPKLTTYHTVDMQVAMNAPDFPWHHITHYSNNNGRRRGGTLTTALNVLQSSRRLEECSLHLTCLRPYILLEVADMSVTCGALTSLTLHVTKVFGQPLRHFFLHCQLPMLRNLVVRTGTCPAQIHSKRIPDGPETFHNMLQCLRRSKSPIAHLKFHFSRVNPQDAIELFQTVTSLETVQLTGIEDGITDDVIQALTLDSQKGAITAPALRNLSLHGDLALTPSVLAKMLRSRWRSTPELWVSIGWSDMKFHDEHRRGWFVYDWQGREEKQAAMHNRIQCWIREMNDLYADLIADANEAEGNLYLYVDTREEWAPDEEEDISSDIWPWRHELRT